MIICLILDNLSFPPFACNPSPWQVEGGRRGGSRPAPASWEPVSKPNRKNVSRHIYWTERFVSVFYSWTRCLANVTQDWLGGSSRKQSPWWALGPTTSLRNLYQLTSPTQPQTSGSVGSRPPPPFLILLSCVTAPTGLRHGTPSGPAELLAPGESHCPHKIP